MTPNEISNLAAEDVFQLIERTKRINKGEIAKAIEKVLLKNPIGYDPIYGTPVFAAALRFLVQQIGCNDYHDGLGHPLKNNFAYHNAASLCGND